MKKIEIYTDTDSGRTSKTYNFIQWIADRGNVIVIVEELERGEIRQFELSK